MAGLTPIWTRWDCRHQHRVSVALQTRPHNTLPASVRCTVVKETWWCWTLQLATGCTTCSVTSKNNLSIKCKKKVGDTGDASPHFSAWWGPHRKRPPPPTFLVYQSLENFPCNAPAPSPPTLTNPPPLTRQLPSTAIINHCLWWWCRHKMLYHGPVYLIWSLLKTNTVVICSNIQCKNCLYFI